MTYGEVGTARTAIGSGLVQHGIPKASAQSFNLDIVGLDTDIAAEVLISQSCSMLD